MALFEILGAFMGARESKKASKIQAEQAEAGADEVRRQFDTVLKLLEPYTQPGVQAINKMGTLAGISGPVEQSAAFKEIENSPIFQGLAQQGENALLQNASATGGLRGGNLQGALAQFRPQMLSQLIEQQYGRLSGIAGLGQASAAGTGAAAQNAGAQVADLFQQKGAAQAGGRLAQGAFYAGIPAQINSSMGQMLAAMGGKF
jgi:hypothetical protein